MDSYGKLSFKMKCCRLGIKQTKQSNIAVKGRLQFYTDLEGLPEYSMCLSICQWEEEKSMPKLISGLLVPSISLSKYFSRLQSSPVTLLRFHSSLMYARVLSQSEIGFSFSLTATGGIFPSIRVPCWTSTGISPFSTRLKNWFSTSWIFACNQEWYVKWCEHKWIWMFRIFMKAKLREKKELCAWKQALKLPYCWGEDTLQWRRPWRNRPMLSTVLL